VEANLLVTRRTRKVPRKIMLKVKIPILNQIKLRRTRKAWRVIVLTTTIKTSRRYPRFKSPRILRKRRKRVRTRTVRSLQMATPKYKWECP